MYLKFDLNNDKLIVNLMGELDHHSAEEVRVRIDDRIQREEVKKVILDFKGVTFMDSSGIGVVVGRYKKINAKGGALCITNINRSVNKVFELSGLFKVIKSYETVEEAVECI
ncbi:MAG: anti-sigma F factor antagonist [Clostridium sp.]